MKSSPGSRLTWTSSGRRQPSRLHPTVPGTPARPDYWTSRTSRVRVARSSSRISAMPQAGTRPPRRLDYRCRFPPNTSGRYVVDTLVLHNRPNHFAGARRSSARGAVCELPSRVNNVGFAETEFSGLGPAVGVNLLPTSSSLVIAERFPRRARSWVRFSQFCELRGAGKASPGQGDSTESCSFSYQSCSARFLQCKARQPITRSIHVTGFTGSY